MADKQKITSPKGELRYVVVNGEGKLDYDGKYREYTASIVLPKKEGKKFLKEITDYFNENKSSKCPFDEPQNKVMRKTEEGDFMFSFKTKCEFTNKDGEVKKTKVQITNGKNVPQELPDGVGIGNGSLGRITGMMDMHGNTDKSEKKNTEGVSLWLNAIQISKFIKYVPDNGFDEDEEAEFESFGDPDFSESAEDAPKKDKKKKKKNKKKRLTDNDLPKGLPVIDIDEDEIPF